MKLNKIWGYGQLFGFSALDGTNRYFDDNILTTRKEPLSFRFEFVKTFTMSFPTRENISFNAIMSDFVDAKIGDKDFYLTFLNNDTLVGISPVLPLIKGEEKLIIRQFGEVTTYSLDKHSLGIRSEKVEGGYKFVIHHSYSYSEARSGANQFFDKIDISELKKKSYSYYEKMPVCKDEKYEELYYKALSINKVNVRSAEGMIEDIWTTPDRVPHRHMWLWDTAFHSLAMVIYNQDVAKRSFISMLKTQRENGFIPHMANPLDQSDVTQPCVMAWATYHLYQETKDLDFVKTCIPYLDKYLTYDINFRDQNKNGLLEWLTEPYDKRCRCGESGLDNSPRFDFDDEMDAIDFSTYLAQDAYYLSNLYKLIGNKEKEKEWLEVANKTKDAINKLMYSEEKGVYFDRLFSGKLTNVLTPASFFPMMAGIPDKSKIKKMIEVLTDKTELWCKNPISTISQKDPRFSNDMWRGGVWLNLNYFIILGLRKYGEFDLAKKLRDDTLEMVNKWYNKEGTIFEFFDPLDKVSPLYCERKGKPLKTPDYRKHVHSIVDYNWSACFTMLLIQDKYYE